MSEDNKKENYNFDVEEDFGGDPWLILTHVLLSMQKEKVAMLAMLKEDESFGKVIGEHTSLFKKYRLHSLETNLLLQKMAVALAQKTAEEGEIEKLELYLKTDPESKKS